MNIAKSTARAVGVIALALGALGCQSPVDADRVTDQGPEIPGVPRGSEHRYGQDCLACHGGYGEGPEFAFAGTVFASPEEDIPVKDAIVTVTDANGTAKSIETNCAGNFYVELEDFVPAFPLRAEIECPNPGDRAVMQTRISREGGCGFCHENAAPSSSSPGRISCNPNPGRYTLEKDCSGGPQ